MKKHFFTGILTMPKCLPEAQKAEVVDLLHLDQRFLDAQQDPAFRIERKEDKVFVTVPTFSGQQDALAEEDAAERIAVAWRHTLAQVIGKQFECSKVAVNPQKRSAK